MSTPPQGYVQAARGGDPDQYSCTGCGAMVHAASATKHTSWHRNLGETINNELVKYQRSRS